MCDNLGISGTKVEVYSFTFLGKTIVFRTKESLMDWIDYEVDNIELEDNPEEMIIKKVTMTESALENLKEFEGY